MLISAETVAEERARLEADADHYANLINDTREGLGAHFDQTVGTVTVRDVEQAIATVFRDGDRAVNVAALCAILRSVDVEEDYPGFVVDEMLGRRLATTMAGGEPQRMLAAATFHFVDIRVDDTHMGAGLDDLHAGVTAGLQTIMPGWEWQDQPSPFESLP